MRRRFQNNITKTTDNSAKSKVIHKIDMMNLTDVIKIVVLNQTVRSSTSTGNNSASDVTGTRLLYSSDQ